MLKMVPGTYGHACNPSYSGGREQEDHGLKPTWANSSQDPISKTLHKNRAGTVAQCEGPEFKPQYQKKKDNKVNECRTACISPGDLRSSEGH
jgi:hypothetical protein